MTLGGRLAEYIYNSKCIIHFELFERTFGPDYLRLGLGPELGPTQGNLYYCTLCGNHFKKNYSRELNISAGAPREHNMWHILFLLALFVVEAVSEDSLSPFPFRTKVASTRKLQTIQEPVYAVITAGWCRNYMNMESITTTAICDASIFMWGYSVESETESFTNYPYGCYHYSSNTAYVNLVTYSSVPCQLNLPCHCLYTCPAGTYNNVAQKYSANSCPQCPAGWKQNVAGQGGCEECSVGTYASRPTGSTDCASCEIGRYQDTAKSSTCKICPQGYKSSEVGNTFCSECWFGHFNPFTAAYGSSYSTNYNEPYKQYMHGGCRQCPKGFHQDSKGSSNCKVCASGKYSNEPAATTCKACPVGRYNDIGTQFSQAYGHDSLQDCKICEQGKYQAAESSIACEFCPVGTFNTDPAQAADLHDESSDCLVCAAGTYSTINGRWLPNCDSCRPGTYNDDIASDASHHDNPNDCKVCPGGRYSNQNANVALADCTQCPQGRFNSDAGTASSSHDDLSDCTQCAGGKFGGAAAGQVDESVACEQCVVGTAQQDLGQVGACPTCTRGKYQDQVGELGCKGCVAGRSNEHTDDAVPSLHVDCYDCVKGTFQNELAQQFCKDCPAGWHNDELVQFECKLCAAGKVTTGARRHECSNCFAGTYLPETSRGLDRCLPCTDATEQGATTCRYVVFFSSYLFLFSLFFFLFFFFFFNNYF